MSRLTSNLEVMLGPSRLTSSLSRLRLPERWRGGRVERVLNYWRGVANDYREAGVEAADMCRRRPRRAAVLAAAGLAAGVAAGGNPDERDYEDAFVLHGQQLACVPDSIRSGERRSTLGYY